MTSCFKFRSFKSELIRIDNEVGLSIRSISRFLRLKIESGKELTIFKYLKLMRLSISDGSFSMITELPRSKTLNSLYLVYSFFKNAELAINCWPSSKDKSTCIDEGSQSSDRTVRVVLRWTDTHLGFFWVVVDEGWLSFEAAHIKFSH